MSTVVYISLVSKGDDGGYRASFPDFADCAAQGGDLAELLANARSAVATRLEALEAAGEAWPSATPIERIDAPAGVMPMPIDVAVDDPPIRVNISLGERLVQRLDAAAGRAGMTRSGFIAKAVRASLGEGGRGAATDFEAMARRLQAELSALGRRINDSIGPESHFSRRMSEFDEAIYDGVRRAADTVSAAVAKRQDAGKRSPGVHDDVEAL